MKILGLIPARGGSKGILKKNLASLNGYPIIYYSIREALKVPELNRIFVSTDDEEIKQYSEKLGLELRFLRSAELAADNSRTIDVVIDVLKKLKSLFKEDYDYVCLLQPTSPLRTAADIINCINIVKKTPGVSVVSLTELDEPHPYKLKIIKDGFVMPFIEGSDSSVPRQELQKVFFLNGAVYLTDTATIFNKKTFFSNRVVPYLMPIERSVNINSSIDLKFCSFLLNDRER